MNGNRDSLFSSSLLTGLLPSHMIVNANHPPNSAGKRITLLVKPLYKRRLHPEEDCQTSGNYHGQEEPENHIKRFRHLHAVGQVFLERETPFRGGTFEQASKRVCQSTWNLTQKMQAQRHQANDNEQHVRWQLTAVQQLTQKLTNLLTIASQRRKDKEE